MDIRSIRKLSGKKMNCDESYFLKLFNSLKNEENKDNLKFRFIRNPKPAIEITKRHVLNNGTVKIEWIYISIDSKYLENKWISMLLNKYSDHYDYN